MSVWAGLVFLILGTTGVSGEQQMLALARGLMARPRLLCLDDPFLGLGRQVITSFCHTIRALTAGGIAILAAGQHVRRLLRLADRAYLLDEGQVVRSGSGAELFQDDRLRRALLDLIPGIDQPVG